MSRRNALMATLFITAAVIAGGWTLKNRLAQDRAGEWVSVQRGELILGVEVTGTLAAENSVTLGPPQIQDVWNFKISMMAPEGREVRAGMPVLGFDTSELEQELEQKSAEAETARTEIEKTRADLKLKREENELQLAEAEAEMRRTELKLEAPQDIVGVREIETIRADHAVAKKRVTHLRQQLDVLQRAADAEISLLQSKFRNASERVAAIRQSMASMSVRAPRPGTVIYTTSRRGGDEKKKVGDSVWRMETVMEIPDLTSIVAKGEIDEADVSFVQTGQRVFLRLDAHPDVRYGGTIRELGRTVQQRSQRDPAKILPIEITLDRTDMERMRPGMRFRGTVELERLRDVLVVPKDALVFVDGTSYVMRRTPFGSERVEVKLGRDSDEQYEIVGGLSAGDRILIPSDDASQGASS